ncbi:MAG TPA: OmpA family protein [Thermoanaerobaculia bacterium]|nr:OmpA family protein [Thermoanaerobaculia bacterium]
MGPGRLTAALLVLLAAPPGVGAAEAGDPGPWDPATVAAAEAAVARLGPQRGLAIERSIVAIVGLEGGVAAASTGIVATVEQVRQAMQELGARETELEVRVELPADVLFDFDRATIRPDAAQALAHLATLIRSHRGSSTLLEGHTDARGDEAYNQRLSQRRAAAVAAWLVEREDIAAGGLETRGWGESRPAASNDSDEGRQRNRRVEAVIRKGG